MSCPSPDILHAWLDKSLPPDQAAPIDEHVAACATCKAAVDRVARLASVMSLAKPVGPCLSAPKLALLAAGQLEAATKDAFTVHLGRCRKCADALLVVRRSITARVQTPAAQPAASPRPTRPIARPVRRGAGLGWVAAAALAVASIGAGVWFARHQSNDNQGTQVVQPTPPKPPQPQQPPDVVQKPPTPEPEPPKEPEELVVDPKPHVPDPLEEADPTEDPKPPVPEVTPPQKPPEDLAQNPPQPEPPAPEDVKPPTPEPTAPRELPFDLVASIGNFDVQLPGAKTWQGLHEGQTLKATGRVSLKVGGSKAARVTLAGHVLSLDKSSEITVALFERDCELALSRGAALVDARGAKDRTLSFDLAGARVHAKAARFLAALSNRQGRVVAFDGDVNVESSGQNVAVPHGQGCLLAEGKAPGEPAKADANALLVWTRDLETFVTAEAEKCRLKDPMKTRTDSSASGGRYVTSSVREREEEPGTIEATFDAKRAGLFRLYIRASAGDRREAGAFLVSIDGGKPRELSVRGRGEEWGWSGLDPIELAAGRHTIRFGDRRGGLRLDTIIVTTDTLFHPDPAAAEKERSEDRERREGEPEPDPGRDRDSDRDGRGRR